MPKRHKIPVSAAVHMAISVAPGFYPFFGNSNISDHLGIVVRSARDIYVSSSDSLYVPE